NKRRKRICYCKTSEMFDVERSVMAAEVASEKNKDSYCFNAGSERGECKRGRRCRPKFRKLKSNCSLYRLSYQFDTASLVHRPNKAQACPFWVGLKDRSHEPLPDSDISYESVKGSFSCS